MIFADRLDAARRLATALDACRGRNPLILAIPRGAVPMGAALATELGGAIDESGWSFVSDATAADKAWLRRERACRLDQLRRRRALYSPEWPAVDPHGRIAIIVDDGLATGATMLAALHALRARDPARLICAVPVAAPDSLERVRPHADEVVCLPAPRNFNAVGQFYARFDQVEDDEVIACLRRFRPAAPARR